MVELSPQIFFLLQAVPMFIFFLSNTTSVIFTMITRHRTEFNRHCTQLLGQAFGWLISIGLLLLESYISCVFISCLVTEGTTYDVKLAGNGDDLCSFIERTYTETISPIGRVILFKFNQSMLTLLPITFFLVFYTPHDCFRCFGKNPNQTYSIFQNPRVTKALK